MLMQCFCMFNFFFFFLIFFIKAYNVGTHLNCIDKSINAMQMGTHNISLYEEVDKNTLAVIWRLRNCLTVH